MVDARNDYRLLEMVTTNAREENNRRVQVLRGLLCCIWLPTQSVIWLTWVKHQLKWVLPSPAQSGKRESELAPTQRTISCLCENLFFFL